MDGYQNFGDSSSRDPVVVIERNLSDPVRNRSPSQSVASTESSGMGPARVIIANNPSNTDRTPLLMHNRLLRSLTNTFGGGNGGSTNSSPTRGGMPNASPGGTVRSLNTFSGVFTSVSLSMFSAILFLRVGESHNLMSVDGFIESMVDLLPE
jgi:hypothetical protein